MDADADIVRLDQSDPETLCDGIILFDSSRSLPPVPFDYLFCSLQ